MACVFIYDKGELTSDTLSRLVKSGSVINVISNNDLNSFKPIPRRVVRIIGLFGAVSLLAGAYGAHGNALFIRVYVKPCFRLSSALTGLARAESKYRRMFQMGAHYQLLHSLVLLGIPFVTYPSLTAVLFISGNLLFSGSCYYMAWCGQENALRMSILGSVALTLAWLSMAL
ncbi:unnamed protein product [Echinostoma caproni]|uniref:Transmembrane protein 256 n=1 Tax=Echinostoma caproni TaxID=27848 RepID=A0A183AZ68_9TREM|nr:unnamed protein product [Echinostoma caproni]